MTGNWFAPIALFSWPLIALALFARLPANRAIIWTILGALLVLPSVVSVKVEMIPTFDKTSIPNLCLLGCVLFGGLSPRSKSHVGIADALAILYILSPVLTSLNNTDPIPFGNTILPGVGWYDGISAALSQLIFLVPFFVGRRFLASAADVYQLLRALSIAGLVYSVPMLFEIRMSPQLSTWIYGYFPSSFAVEMRYGGFRPVVFMRNGLAAAFFLMTSSLATLALYKANPRSNFNAGLGIFLGLVVLLCKSAGALVYELVGAIVIRFFKPRTAARLGVLLASIALAYPLLRAADLFPDQTLIEVSRAINADRAKSLDFRFTQENELLNHAWQRIVFGWGRYGRNRLYDEYSGGDTSTTDGQWIITIGQFGIIGFLAEFGLLIYPVYKTSTALRYVRDEKERILLSALLLIHALTVVEQLPNASISSWTWLIAGCLLGRAEQAFNFASVRRKSADVKAVDGVQLTADAGS
jgi:hypothetical protein